jgi:hypothetical protein
MWLLFETEEKAQIAQQQITDNLNSVWVNPVPAYSNILQLTAVPTPEINCVICNYGFSKPDENYPACAMENVVYDTEADWTQDWFLHEEL